MVRIVICLQLLKSHRNRRNSLVLDKGNTLFFIFGKILLILLIILIIFLFLLVTFLFLSFRVFGCLRNLKFMVDLHGLFVFLNMNYQKLDVDYY